MGKQERFQSKVQFNILRLTIFIFLCNRNSSKKALTNDLIEGLQKELDKLQKKETTLKNRVIGSMKGG